MPMWLTDDEFPAPEQADENGVIAIGGDFSLKTLLNAYRQGIFPWPHSGITLWFCPDPRFVLFPREIIISSSLKKTINKTKVEICFNSAFSLVMKKCQQQIRKNQDGTWITDEMIEGYNKLHQAGFAHSVEA